VRNGDDAILALDQVLVLDLALDVDDLGLARRREFRLDRRQFALTMSTTRARDAQDREILFDLGRDLVQFVGDFIAAERGQALQTQIRGWPWPALPTAGRCRCPSLWRGSAISSISGAMSLAGQSRAISCSRLRRTASADQLDDFVDVGDRDRKADQDVRAIACLVQQVLGAARHDVLAEGDEGLRSCPSGSAVSGRPPLIASMLAPNVVCRS
jgi:hypothetical protein